MATRIIEENGGEVSAGDDLLRLVNDLQCNLEDIAAVATVTADSCGGDPECHGVLRVIAREVEAVRTGLDDVVRMIDKECKE